MSTATGNPVDRINRRIETIQARHVANRARSYPPGLSRESRSMIMQLDSAVMAKYQEARSKAANATTPEDFAQLEALASELEALVSDYETRRSEVSASSDPSFNMLRNEFEEKYQMLSNDILLNSTLSPSDRNRAEFDLRNIYNRVAGLTPSRDSLDDLRQIIKDLENRYTQLRANVSESSVIELTALSVDDLDSEDLSPDSGNKDLEKSNEFLNTVRDEVQNLRRRLILATNGVITSVNTRVNVSRVVFRRTEQADQKRKKAEIESEISRLTREMGPDISATQARFLETRIRDLQDQIDRIDEILGRTDRPAVEISTEELREELDQYILAARQYRENMVAALEDVQGLDGKALTAIRKRIEPVFAQMVDVSVLFPDSASDFVKSFITSDRIRFSGADRQNLEVATRVIQDTERELIFSVESINREIIRSLRDPDRFRSTSRSARSNLTILVLVFKAFRTGTTFLALFLAELIYTNFHRRRQLMANNSDREFTKLDLKWFPTIYISLQLSFDMVFVVVLWVIGRLDPNMASRGAILDASLDAILGLAMTAATSYWIADVIQDNRYFSFETNAPRALRILKTIMQWIAPINSVIPYYQIVGPRFIDREIQRKRSEESEQSVQ